MSLDFAPTIGDDYPEYVDDELGYRYHAWEVISASESDRLQEIRRLDEDRLDEITRNLDDPTDLERWALARRRLDGDPEAYFRHVEAIVDGALDHPALDYPEVFVDLARQRARTGDLEAGRRIVDRMESRWPELEEAIPLLHAQLSLEAGDAGEAHDRFERALEPHQEDVDLRIETAEDFLEADEIDYARTWLENARRAADLRGDRPSLVDIQLLEQRLPETAATDEASTGAPSDRQPPSPASGDETPSNGADPAAPDD